MDEPPWRTRLRDQLAADRAVRKEMTAFLHPRGVFMCGMRILGAEARSTVLYAWLLCGDLTTGAGAEMWSGSSLPAVIWLDSPRGDLASVEFPQQATLEEDIDRMFPGDLAQEVRNRPQETVPTSDELDAIALALPPAAECRARSLRVSADGSGGPAMGTWYVPMTIANVGPDCLLTTLTLQLWAGRPATRLAALDLSGRGQHMALLRTGDSVLGRVSAPNEQCVHRAVGRLRLVPVSYSDSVSRSPIGEVGGAGIPSGFLACPDVSFIADGGPVS